MFPADSHACGTHSSLRTPLRLPPRRRSRLLVKPARSPAGRVLLLWICWSTVGRPRGCHPVMRAKTVATAPPRCFQQRVLADFRLILRKFKSLASDGCARCSGARLISISYIRSFDVCCAILATVGGMVCEKPEKQRILGCRFSYWQQLKGSIATLQETQRTTPCLYFLDS